MLISHEKLIKPFSNIFAAGPLVSSKLGITIYSGKLKGLNFLNKKKAM